MGLPLPQLDDRTYADLVDEARALIPAYDPDWTDHNASDPGIALVELLAWLAEMLVYRADQVPERHVVTFLRLLNGPSWTWSPPPDAPRDLRARLLDDEVRTTVLRLRETYRAVTCADYERLAQAAPSAVAAVSRAHCVARRHLDASVDTDRPGHVTLVVIPDRPLDDDASVAFHADVAEYLAPRRVLTTNVHVVAPLVAPLHAELFVAPRADVATDQVEQDVRAALADFFDPARGGPEGGGWPFGRDVFASEVYAVLEAVPSVDYVPFVALTSPASGEPRTAPATELWHENGDQVGLALGPYQLPRLEGEPDLYVSARFVSVTVNARVTAVAGAAPADVRRSVKLAVRRFFHPAYGGPSGERWGPTPVVQLQHAVATAPGVAAVADGDVTVTTAPDRIVRDELGHPQIEIRTGELVDVQPFVTVL